MSITVAIRVRPAGVTKGGSDLMNDTSDLNYSQKQQNETLRTVKKQQIKRQSGMCSLRVENEKTIAVISPNEQFALMSEANNGNLEYHTIDNSSMPGSRVNTPRWNNNNHMNVSYSRTLSSSSAPMGRHGHPNSSKLFPNSSTLSNKSNHSHHSSFLSRGSAESHFQFNHCFSSDVEDMHYASQADIFDTLGKPAVDNVLNGFNTCIMAYGQTASGKTYSMLGPGWDDTFQGHQKPSRNNIYYNQNFIYRLDETEGRGLMLRVCKGLFEKIEVFQSEETYEGGYHELIKEDFRKKKLLRMGGDLKFKTAKRGAADNKNQKLSQKKKGEQGSTTEEDDDESGATSQTTNTPTNEGIDCYLKEKDIAGDTSFQMDGEPSTLYRVEVSYFQIYLEKVSCLLQPDAAGLKVRYNSVVGPYVEGLTAVPITSYSEMLQCLEMGTRHRVVASTVHNHQSSRSHSIFSVTVTREHCTADGSKTSRSAVLHLVDLAGSERIGEAKNVSKQRHREASNINGSLSVLGKVIHALSRNNNSNNGKQQQSLKEHVPYRDSVLTSLLKESFGGNSKTIMLATVSPELKDLEETKSTLAYACKARNIVNKPTVNEDIKNQQIVALKLEIEDLRRRLMETESVAAAMGKKPQVNHVVIGGVTGEYLMETPAHQHCPGLQGRIEGDPQDESALIEKKRLKMAGEKSHAQKQKYEGNEDEDDEEEGNEEEENVVNPSATVATVMEKAFEWKERLGAAEKLLARTARSAQSKETEKQELLNQWKFEREQLQNKCREIEDKRKVSEQERQLLQDEYSNVVADRDKRIQLLERENEVLRRRQANAQHLNYQNTMGSPRVYITTTPPSRYSRGNRSVSQGATTNNNGNKNQKFQRATTPPTSAYSNKVPKLNIGSVCSEAVPSSLMAQYQHQHHHQSNADVQHVDPTAASYVTPRHVQKSTLHNKKDASMEKQVLSSSSAEKIAHIPPIREQYNEKVMTKQHAAEEKKEEQHRTPPPSQQNQRKSEERDEEDDKPMTKKESSEKKRKSQKKTKKSVQLNLQTVEIIPNTPPLKRGENICQEDGAKKKKQQNKKNNNLSSTTTSSSPSQGKENKKEAEESPSPIHISDTQVFQHYYGEEGARAKSTSSSAPFESCSRAPSLVHGPMPTPRVVLKQYHQAELMASIGNVTPLMASSKKGRKTHHTTGGLKPGAGGENSARKKLVMEDTHIHNDASSFLPQKYHVEEEIKELETNNNEDVVDSSAVDPDEELIRQLLTEMGVESSNSNDPQMVKNALREIQRIHEQQLEQQRSTGEHSLKTQRLNKDDDHNDDGGEEKNKKKKMKSSSSLSPTAKQTVPADNHNKSPEEGQQTPRTARTSISQNRTTTTSSAANSGVDEEPKEDVHQKEKREELKNTPTKTKKGQANVNNCLTPLSSPKIAAAGGTNNNSSEKQELIMRRSQREKKIQELKAREAELKRKRGMLLMNTVLPLPQTMMATTGTTNSIQSELEGNNSSRRHVKFEQQRHHHQSSSFDDQHVEQNNKNQEQEFNNLTRAATNHNVSSIEQLLSIEQQRAEMSKRRGMEIKARNVANQISENFHKTLKVIDFSEPQRSSSASSSMKNQKSPRTLY